MMRSILASVMITAPLLAYGQFTDLQVEDGPEVVTPFNSDGGVDTSADSDSQDVDVKSARRKVNPNLPKIMEPAASDAGETAGTGELPVDNNELINTHESRPPGLFEVDEEAATRALERSLIQIDALLLAPGHVELGFGIASSQDEQLNPILLQRIDDDSLLAGKAKWRTETSSSRFELQLGLPFDSEVDLSVPFNSVFVANSVSAFGEIVEERRDTSSGWGDARVTLLKTVLKERGRRPDVIALVTHDADTAEQKVPAIGSGASETTIALNATKRQDPLVFVFGLSHTLETHEEGFRSGARTSFTAGTVLAASPRTSLRFLLTQIRSEESTQNGQLLDDDQGTSALLNLGVSSVVSRNVFVTAGVSAALTANVSDYAFDVVISRRFDLLDW